ncbi:glycosyltransferase family 4 protein [Paenisporosarcina sp. TG-14]|uniref:glycosyltransferase family 4 protein n=1 Tax=Paenisporosarcina sp. TG-14 TaxID=1231057 RepID=UPI0002ED01C3|nr:glycosyltransferase family 4 protein [Paenisporosarcina sp. TG-14]
MKVLYVTTISNTVNAFLIPHIKLLIDQGHQVDLAFNSVQELNPEVLELGCAVHNIEFQRSPLNKKNYNAFKMLKKLIENENYDLVHTHTPIASACVRLACRKMSVIVIYTAHGFHFYKGAPIKNWVIYYPLERYLSKYTDVLITINKEDYRRARKSFDSKRVEYVPGVGLNTKRFINVSVNNSEKRKELSIPLDAFVALSVGELNKNKNHETIIRAIAKLKNSNIYYILCGQGPLESYLIKLIIDLGLEKQVSLLGFRTDIDELCKISDIFVFPSKREGLGMAALEAMATGLPIITSNIHGIVDYSVNGETGFTCNPTDIKSFAKAIKKLQEDKLLRNKMGRNNQESVNIYSVENAIDKNSEIYQNYIT